MQAWKSPSESEQNVLGHFVERAAHRPTQSWRKPWRHSATP